MYYHSFTFVLQMNHFVRPVIYVLPIIHVCITTEYFCITGHLCTTSLLRLYFILVILYYRTFIYLYVQVKTIWEEQFYTNEQGPHGEHQELRNVMLHPVIEWRGLSVHLPETVS